MICKVNCTVTKASWQGVTIQRNNESSNRDDKREEIKKHLLLGAEVS